MTALGDRTTTTAAPAGPASRPVLVWAAVGAGFAALQIYVYVSWIASSDFVSTPHGPDALNSGGRFWVPFFQILSPLMAVAVLAWVARGCRREKRFTFDAMVVTVWAGLYWLDPFINVLRPQFFYNSYLINRGSWVDHIPGWISPNGHLLPEPLVFLGAIYLWMGPIATFMACGAMRRIRARYPQATTLRTIVGAWAAMVLFLLACELFFIRTGMYAYPLAIHQLSIWGGHTYQYPLAELFIWPMVWVSMGALRSSRDADGQTFLDRGLDQVSAARARPLLRTLSMLGYATVAMLIYYVPMTALTAYTDRVPDGYPSYLTNGMCGPGTGVACPGPGVPIPVP